MNSQSLNAAAWSACVVLLALLAATARTQSCSAPGAPTIELSVSSKRNTTGHWNIAVDARSEQKRRLSARPREGGVEVSVRQRAAHCDSTDAVHLSATASVSNKVLHTPAGYEPMQDLGYYRWATSLLAWEDAALACAAEGAHLIVINSDLEANVVRLFIARKPIFKNTTHITVVHVGFHARHKADSFETVQGLPLNDTGYIQWRSGEPNRGSSYFCGTADDEGKLRMGRCTDKLAYICEFES